MQSTADFTPTTDLLSGSPKMMITFFILTQCREFSGAMQHPKEVDIDAVTADLLSYCTDVPTRDKLWKAYVERKKDPLYEDSKVTPAILTKGDFWAYICDVLEFTEKSAGGF